MSDRIFISHATEDAEMANNIVDYIEKHMECIQRKVSESRNGYLRYSEKCGILPGHYYAVVDGFAIGNTQSFLAKTVPDSSAT